MKINVSCNPTYFYLLQTLLTCPAPSPALCDAACRAYALAPPVVKSHIVKIRDNL